MPPQTGGRPPSAIDSTKSSSMGRSYKDSRSVATAMVLTGPAARSILSPRPQMIRGSLGAPSRALSRCDQ